MVVADLGDLTSIDFPITNLASMCGEVILGGLVDNTRRLRLCDGFGNVGQVLPQAGAAILERNKLIMALENGFEIRSSQFTVRTWHAKIISNLEF